MFLRGCRLSGRVKSTNCYRITGNRFNHARRDARTLTYQEHYKYGCLSNNWGASKGLDHYNDVCVVLGATHWKVYETSSLAALPPQTKNKLYVAFSRTRGRLFLAPEKLFKPFKTT